MTDTAPDFVAQNGEPMTGDERMAWFRARYEEFREKGATWGQMAVEEVCESKLDTMKVRERRIDWRRYSWEDRELAKRDATRLAAYQRKRLAHDAFNSYDAAMTAKGLA